MSLDKESQFDEISSLESIYNSEEFTFSKENEVFSGQFLAMTTVSPGFTIQYKNLILQEDPLKCLKLEYLPPICLYFDLPPDYPSTSPPVYKLSCPWLSLKQKVSLCDKLDKLWAENEGMAILFTWMNFLKNESLDHLQVADRLNLSGLYTKEIKTRNRTLIDKKTVESEGKNDNVKEEITGHRSIPESAFIRGKDCLNNRIVAETSKFNKPPHHLKKHGSKIENMLVTYGPKILNKPVNNLLEYLVCYNDDRSKIEFSRTLFPCEICFQNQTGSKCIQFKPCDHIYCSECIFSYFEVRIKENMIHSMPCPHEKCTSEASQNQIKEIVGPELFTKYDSLLLNATLDTMADIVYCPRKSCQLPVLLEVPERMAMCPNCKYAFCAFCKMTYHGIEPCRMRTEDKRALAMEYENSVGEERRRLEARYGQKQLITLLENVKSTDWISTNSKNCPSCFAFIEKSDGCNKMVCGKCNTMFCWLCSAKLDSTAPYKHFFDPKSECNNLLFQGLMGANEVEDFDEDVIFEDDDEDMFYLDDEGDDDYIFLNI